MAKDKRTMNLPGQFLLVVLGVAAATAALMVPRTNEWFAVMRDDEKQAQIVSLLEPKLVREGDDPRLLATLGRAHADLGDTARAVELLERYVKLRPLDADAYGRLGELYGAMGQQAQQEAALERSVALAMKLPYLTELADVYRSGGKPDAERTLLARYESALTVRSGLLMRLANLYVNNHEERRAVAVLSRSEVIQTSAKGTRNDEERLLLGRLLAETGQSGEALRLARMWIGQWHEPWLASRLLLSLAARLAEADADALADAVADLHPAIRFYMAKQLADGNAPAVARHLVRTWWLANPRPSTDEIAGFLFACREWGEPAMIWEAFAGVLGAGAPPAIVGRYAEAIVAEFGIDALAPVWSSISPAVLERTPLLAARLAFAQGDLGRSRWLTSRIDVSTLSAPDQTMWVELLKAAGSPEMAFDTMRTLRRRGGLPRTLLVQYARLAGSFGQDDEYQLALAALRRGE